MSHDNVSRGVPAQALPENQDPAVQYNIDEVTGAVNALVGAPAAAAGTKEKKAGAKKTVEAPQPAEAVAEEAPSDPGAGE